MSNKTLRKQPKVGDIVHITFWDHSDAEVDTAEPLLFECYGRVAEATKLRYLISLWNTPGKSDVERYNSNSEFYSIIRGTIVSARVLK